VTETVKTRPYRSQVRAEKAAATRRAVLDAARDLMVAKGYDATTVAEIARDAGVSVDTVYASVGRKPELVVAVIDMVLGSSHEPIPAEQRDYVVAIRAARTGREKLQLYAGSLGVVMPRTAPLIDALRRAGETDAQCAAAWTALVDRRARNMLLFAADLRASGDLRADLDDGEVADIVWSTNAPEYYLLLAARGWSTERYVRLLEDLWCRLLLQGHDGVA
jgi:AcrR family transcriptional regulator